MECAPARTDGCSQAAWPAIAGVGCDATIPLPNPVRIGRLPLLALFPSQCQESLCIRALVLSKHGPQCLLQHDNARCRFRTGRLSIWRTWIAAFGSYDHCAVKAKRERVVRH